MIRSVVIRNNDCRHRSHCRSAEGNPVSANAIVQTVSHVPCDVLSLTAATTKATRAARTSVMTTVRRTRLMSTTTPRPLSHFPHAHVLHAKREAGCRHEHLAPANRIQKRILMCIVELGAGIIE